MKILAISQVYWPDTASVSQHLSDLLELLAKKEHEVTVFTSKNNYEDSSIKYPNEEINRGVSIFRINNTGFGKKTKIGRLIDFFTFNALIFLKMLFLKKKSYDLIIGLTSPPLLSYFGLKIARLKKIKFLYWTMDLQPELSIVAGYFDKNSFSARTLQKRGDYIFKNSDKIITLDRFMVEHIRNRVKSNANIASIPVWPVVEEVYNGKRLENPFRIQNNFKNKIVIMYSGNHSVMHPLDTLLEAAKLLKEDTRFLFVHIGGGVRLKDVSEFKKANNLENIILLPYQPRNLIHLSLGSADIQVVSLGAGCVGYTHPNKIYGAMFIGKPILYLGPNPSHITDILDNCHGNIIVNHGESKRLVELIQSFSDLDESEKILIGERNQSFAKKNFAPSLLLEKMVSEIENI